MSFWRQQDNVKFAVNSSHLLSLERFTICLCSLSICNTQKSSPNLRSLSCSRSVTPQLLTMRLAFVLIVLTFKFYFTLGIFKAGRNADSENDSFKVHSSFTSMLNFPYAVKIFSRENQQTLSGFSCSGSIVHQLWIITAAHCVYGFNVSDVFIGNVTNDADHVMRAAQTFIHPNYTFDPELSHDIALMKLKRSLETLNNSKLNRYL
jgi:Trypsin